MSEDSSSDEEWQLDAHPVAKCWECGKKFSKITSLMSHYKSHNIRATCYICKVTFRRLTSLSMHLDNAHSPPLCKKCNQSFSNGWELNKHAETYCMGFNPFQGTPSLISAIIYQNNDNFPIDATAQQSIKSVLHDSVSELRPQQRMAMKPERAETSKNSVEYTVGEDDNDIDIESDCEEADDSASTESDDEDKTRSQPADLCPDDPDSDGGSSSTGSSSEPSHSPHTETAPAALPTANSSICAACGRGPFRSMKLHLLHCSGIKVKYQCSVCKKLFLTELSLKEHYMPLYSCKICGQVFPNKNSYHHEQCPVGTKSPLVLFCPESMPQACSICKSFFTTAKNLLIHVTKVHTSVVSTKVCIITNPSVLTDKKVSPGYSGTAAHSANSSPNVVNQVINAKLCVSQAHAGSPSIPSFLSTSSHEGRPPATLYKESTATPVRLGKDGAFGPTTQPVSRLSAPLNVPPGAADKTSATVACDPVTPSMPTIMAMFENDSQDIALMKRMNTRWRSKPLYPCRQCGAILRQPSLIIRHRYLHRGYRSHQCQCGRAFKHRLHLLRHCVQHAETISYICVSCGETFIGATLLAEHMKGKSRKKSHSACTWKRKVKRKCRMPFTCACGQLFFRPSAYIWHQLKNRTKTKQLKMPLE
ncbi:zinc finger protein Xfin [Etheostoma spectabile]|uniref:zinc finger protein Xfin n=1 Tax=Etheostoma spectabile TaxID=54343 RepID=UPI0013AFCE4D|nr:zinc finger protein Xfin-like [Etheostoma spectabile]